ncbi:Pectin lyase-like superfamily protein, partial [Prunus dulcis]
KGKIEKEKMAEVTSCFSRVALLMILYILHNSCVAESTLVFIVLRFGAMPNIFKGDNCKSTDITFRIYGTLIASSDYRILGGGRGPKCDIKNAIFKGTQNGLRIKSLARPSNGFVQGVQFLDVAMFNVQNPIVIDQNYCPLWVESWRGVLKICERKCFREFHGGVRVEEGFKHVLKQDGTLQNYNSDLSVLKSLIREPVGHEAFMPTFLWPFAVWMMMPYLYYPFVGACFTPVADGLRSVD